MDNNFDAEIYKALSLAGPKGLKAEKLARHVFNASNSMFHPLVFKDVHLYVLQFLNRNCKKRNAIIERGERHGIYRLNPKSLTAQQLKFRFAPQEEEITTDSQEEDPTQPSLFD